MNGWLSFGRICRDGSDEDLMSLEQSGCGYFESTWTKGTTTKSGPSDKNMLSELIQLEVNVNVNCTKQNTYRPKLEGLGKKKKKKNTNAYLEVVISRFSSQIKLCVSVQEKDQNISYPYIGGFHNII